LDVKNDVVLLKQGKEYKAMVKYIFNDGGTYFIILSKGNILLTVQVKIVDDLKFNKIEKK